MASGFLTISAVTPEAGHAVEDIPVSLQGPPTCRWRCAQYIRDVLRVLDGEEVTLGYTSFRHPVEVKDPSDTDYTPVDAGDVPSMMTTLRIHTDYIQLGQPSSLPGSWGPGARPSTGSPMVPSRSTARWRPGAGASSVRATCWSSQASR